jgi:anti-sigma B factor antagonist
MADVLLEEMEGVLIARLVVARHPSQKQIDDIGRELLTLPERSGGMILLDLREVEFISSALLGKLIALHSECKTGKIDLRIYNVPPLIMDVIKISRLDFLFKIYDSEEDAVGA